MEMDTLHNDETESASYALNVIFYSNDTPKNIQVLEF